MTNKIMLCWKLNDSKKMILIKGCMARWKLDIICFQEFKMEIFSDLTAHNLRKVKEMGWRELLAVGPVGGMWCNKMRMCWKSRTVLKQAFYFFCVQM